MEWHQRHPTGQLLSNANSDVEAAWGPIAPLPMAVGTVAMMLIAIVQMLVADLVLARGRPAGLPGRHHRQRPLPAHGLAADDPGAAAARRGQRDRARVVRRRDGRQDPRPRGRGDPAVRREGRRAARRQHPRRPHPRGVRPGPGGAAQPGRAARARRRRGAGAQRSDGGRRRRDGRLPADDRVVPDPVDRLAAGRVPAQRRRASGGCRRCSTRPARCRTATARAGGGRGGARLELRHVGYSYDPDQTVLDDVTFTVEPGRTVAVVGATAPARAR